MSIKARYIRWMMDKVGLDPCYRPLCLYLTNSVEFEPYVGNDDNRAADGIDLRYKFESETGFYPEWLDDKPCSIFEMMVALAIRCDEDVMYDPELGNRVDLWFWEMFTTLGLEEFEGDELDYYRIDDIFDTFNGRKYDFDGRNGGMFIVENAPEDLRRVELWYQMMWWLNERHPEY